MNKLKFKFYPTVDNTYNFEVFPRFMINFSSQRWKNRKKPIETDNTFILDSGGFNELGKYGKYSFTIDHYFNQINNVIKPDYFATMDWMCEQERLDATGLTVDEHIERTVDNAIEILNKYEGESKPMVVIQGWEVEDYIKCIDKLKEHDCLTEKMGIGSICREVKDDRIKNIIFACREELPNTNLHGFGIKKTMLKDSEVVKALDSSDSFAWSLSNRYNYDLRGKDRTEYLAVWARKVELTAYESLLENRLINTYKKNNLMKICNRERETE